MFINKHVSPKNHILCLQKDVEKRKTLSDSCCRQVSYGQNRAATLSEKLFHVGKVVCCSLNGDVGFEGAGKAAALDAESPVACTGIEEALRHGIGEGDSLLGSRRRAVDVLQVAERGRSAFGYQ